MQTGRVAVMAVLAFAPCAMVAQTVPGVDVWMPRPATTLVPEVMVPARVIADPQAYIVVFRVTTDNRIIVLSPRTPYGGFRVPQGGLKSNGVDVSFHTEPTDGVGHVFAAASYTPFNFARFRSGGDWNVTRLDAPPPGDPQAVADWFLKQIVPTRQTPYSINDVAYYVGVVPPTDDSVAVAQAGPSSVGVDSSVADDESGGAPPPDTGYTPVYTPEDTGFSPPPYTAQTYYYGGGYPPIWGTYIYGGWYGGPPVVVPGYAYGKACGGGVVVPIRGVCPGRGSGRGRYVAMPRLRVPPSMPMHLRWRPRPPVTPNRAPPRDVRPAPRPAPAPRPSTPPSAQRGQSAPLRH